VAMLTAMTRLKPGAEAEAEAEAGRRSDES